MFRNKKEDDAVNHLVFIFKSVKEIVHANDKYEQALSVHNIPCEIVPVLSFRFVNEAKLTSILSCPDELSSIVLTSTRAVEAVGSALKGLKNAIEIVSMQCFVVGHATHDAAVDLGFQPEGSVSGNGEALAEYVLQNVRDSSKTLLFPCSNIHRDSIPKILKSQGLMLMELIVYETCPDENIQECVNKAVDKKGYPEVAVFFSPSGFNSVHSLASQLSFSLEKTKLIALGPATSSSIRDKGYEVYGVAEKPDPKSLLSLVQQVQMEKG